MGGKEGIGKKILEKREKKGTKRTISRHTKSSISQDEHQSSRNLFEKELFLVFNWDFLLFYFTLIYKRTYFAS